MKCSNRWSKFLPVVVLVFAVSGAYAQEVRFVTDTDRLVIGAEREVMKSWNEWRDNCPKSAEYQGSCLSCSSGYVYNLGNRTGELQMTLVNEGGREIAASRFVDYKGSWTRDSSLSVTTFFMDQDSAPIKRCQDTKNRFSRLVADLRTFFPSGRKTLAWEDHIKLPTGAALFVHDATDAGGGYTRLYYKLQDESYGTLGSVRVHEDWFSDDAAEFKEYYDPCACLKKEDAPFEKVLAASIRMIEEGMQSSREAPCPRKVTQVAEGSFQCLFVVNRRIWEVHLADEAGKNLGRAELYIGEDNKLSSIIRFPEE